MSKVHMTCDRCKKGEPSRQKKDSYRLNWLAYVAGLRDARDGAP